MSNKTFLALLGSLLWLGSCSKDDGPPDLSKDPVFVIDGAAGGTPLLLRAGKDSLYLFTDHQRGSDEVWEMRGSFANDRCPAADCPGTLTFVWRNNAAGDNFETTWAAGRYPFYRANGPDSMFLRTRLRYRPDSLSAPEVVWLLNDSLVVTGPETLYDGSASPLHIATDAIYSNGAHSHLEQDFFPGQNSFCLQATVRAQLDTPSVLLTAFPSSPFVEYQWSTGDNNVETSTGWKPSQTYTVTVTETDGSCTAIASLGNIPASAGRMGTGNIEAGAEWVVSYLAGGPVIEWIDPQGQRWRSDRGVQVFPQHSFEIEEIQDYLKNEKGQPTKLLRINWQCRLYDESGTGFLESSGTGVIAVAWPG